MIHDNTRQYRTQVIKRRGKSIRLRYRQVNKVIKRREKNAMAANERRHSLQNNLKIPPQNIYQAKLRLQIQQGNHGIKENV